METEVAQAGVNLNLGSRTWMKRRFNARLLEQGPCLFPNLYPRLPGIAIAPFVKEDAALPQNFLRFTQQPPPVRDEIQKPRQHDGVRAISSKWEVRALGGHWQHRRFAGLSLHSLQHGDSRVDCDYLKTAARKDDSNTACTGADVDNRCNWPQATRYSLGQLVRYSGAMAAIVDLRIG